MKYIMKYIKHEDFKWSCYESDNLKDCIDFLLKKADDLSNNVKEDPF